MGEDTALDGPGQDKSALISRMAHAFRAAKMGLPKDDPRVLKSFRSYVGPMRAAVAELEMDMVLVPKEGE